MNFDYFIYHHPTAYRRLLIACCIGMLVSGAGSLLASQNGGHLSFELPFGSEAATPIARVAQAPAKPVKLTQIPGRDGTAAPSAGAPAVPATAVVATPAPITIAAGGDMRQLGRDMNALRFGDNQWPALNALWTRESNWNPNARNRSSGACGIPQALPCSKILDHSPQGQISWGLSYIQARYGNPNNAWAHSQRYGWY